MPLLDEIKAFRNKLKDTVFVVRRLNKFHFDDCGPPWHHLLTRKMGVQYGMTFTFFTREKIPVSWAINASHLFVQNRIAFEFLPRPVRTFTGGITHRIV